MSAGEGIEGRRRRCHLRWCWWVGKLGNGRDLAGIEAAAADLVSYELGEAGERDVAAAERWDAERSVARSLATTLDVVGRYGFSENRSPWFVGALHDSAEAHAEAQQSYESGRVVTAVEADEQAAIAHRQSGAGGRARRDQRLHRGVEADQPTVTFYNDNKGDQR